MRPVPTVSVEVGGLKADAAAVDALARLALAVRRHGYELRLKHPSPELLDLIELVGLSQTLAVERLRPGSTEPKC
jgi:ABC-type transporter Mla MlaB component